MRKALTLSGVTVVKNAIRLGYPFVESILSLVPLCDEIVISEGYSSDETYHWLERLQARFPDKVRLFRERWPDGLPGGQVIGEMQTRALKRCRGRWIFLLQADEVFPEESVAYVRELCSPMATVRRVLGRRRQSAEPPRSEMSPGQSPPAPEPAVSLPAAPRRRRRWDRHLADLLLARTSDTIAHALIFQSYNVDFEQIDERMQGRHTEFPYRWAVRLARNRAGLYTGSDGWQLQGPFCFPAGTARLPRPLLHLGYNFPVNIWHKSINHARLYPDNPHIQQVAREAQEHLQAWERQKALPAPPVNPLRLPPLLAPLAGLPEYRVREELLSEEQQP